MSPLAQAEFIEIVGARFRRRRLSITKLAQEPGDARNTVSRAINPPTPHPAVKKAVAKNLPIVP